MCAELAPTSPAPVSIETAPSSARTTSAELAPTEWLHTRRGLIGLCEVRTARPSAVDAFVTWVWFTDSGDTGEVDGSDGRSMAITDAYVSLVRRTSPDLMSELAPWERSYAAPTGAPAYGASWAP
jgi:hypothetical protein